MSTELRTKPLILDGGFGRALQDMGIDLDTPLWSARAVITSPEMVVRAHAEFIRAGAQIITTNTYALTRYYLEKAGRVAEQQQLLERAYMLAHRAVRESGVSGVRVAAGIPPLNESYRPDLVNQRIMESEYPFLIQTAVEEGADLIIGETLSSIAEARALLKHGTESGLPVWISFTLNGEGDLRSGESLESAARIVAEEGAAAVLVNCAGVDSISLGVAKLSALAEKIPLTFGAYANRFYPVREGFTLEGGLNRIDEGVSPASYAAHARRWVDQGAGVVGGCCGIGPEYIRLLSEEVRGG